MARNNLLGISSVKKKNTLVYEDLLPSHDRESVQYIYFNLFLYIYRVIHMFIFLMCIPTFCITFSNTLLSIILRGNNTVTQPHKSIYDHFTLISLILLFIFFHLNIMNVPHALVTLDSSVHIQRWPKIHPSPSTEFSYSPSSRVPNLQSDRILHIDAVRSSPKFLRRMRQSTEQPGPFRRRGMSCSV